MDNMDFITASGKTAIITGAANGIGAETARLFHQHGANVVIADLPNTKDAANALIASLTSTQEDEKDRRAIFIPTDILSWPSMLSLFQATKGKFGRVDVVVANAGIMESEHLFQLGVDETGELREPREHHRVVDVNVKGTMNTLALAMHSMKAQSPMPGERHKGSILLLISTSGYFGGSGVMAYVSSKHGVTGLLRASQKEAKAKSVRVNAVAPYFTPTHMTGSFAELWREKGLPANTAEDVAKAVVGTSLDGGLEGCTILAAGQQTREIEQARTALVSQWLGEYMSGLLAAGGKFFESTGGYLLPKQRS